MMNTAASGATAAPTDSNDMARYGILGLLVLLMAATRVNHFVPVPDASWAIFFVAGFYLKDLVRWAFPLLMIEAVLVDYFVISGQGISFWDHYCVSAAYWFLVPAYFTLWLGGSVLRAQCRGLRLRELGLLVASFVVALSVSYLISNGSFYWLADSVPAPRSMAAWLTNLGDWYLPYLQTQSLYVAIAASLHVLAAQALKALPQLAQPARR
jgi:hypothetical protein